jgi:hypothetical protein
MLTGEAVTFMADFAEVHATVENLVKRLFTKATAGFGENIE